MSDFYEGVYDEILPVIEQLGKSIVLIKTLASLGWSQVRDKVTKNIVWKNVDGTIQSKEPSTKLYSGYAVQSSYSHYFGTNLSINVGDVRIYAIDIPKPVPGDIVTVNDENFNVITVNPIEPGAVVLMYDIQLRRG